MKAYLNLKIMSISYVFLFSQWNLTEINYLVKFIFLLFVILLLIYISVRIGFWFLKKSVLGPTKKAKTDVIGEIAWVSKTITEDNQGEITYIAEEQQICIPAYANQKIKRGNKVIILDLFKDGYRVQNFYQQEKI